MDNLFFDSWESLLRTFILTTLAYISMVVFLRSSGKRTLTKMNAFDLIITIALGSALAAVALNKNIPLADGMLAFLVLIGIQFCLTWLSVRSEKVKNFIRSSPTLLFYNDKFLEAEMQRQRMTHEEVFMTARKQNITDLNEISLIILEPTGDITIIIKNDSKINNSSPILKEIQNFPSS